LVLLDSDGRDIEVLEKTSKLSAGDLVAKIKADKAIPQMIRDAINVDPKNKSRITFAEGLKGGRMSNADLAVWEDWKTLYGQAEVAARGKQFAFTTGELKILPEDAKSKDEAGPRSVGNADLPSGSLVTGKGDYSVRLKSNMVNISEPDKGIGGITLPSERQAAILTKEQRETGGGVTVGNDVADGRGLLVVVDRITLDNGTSVPMTDREIVATFFHELAFHGGGIAQEKVGIADASDRVKGLKKILDQVLPDSGDPTAVPADPGPKPSPSKPKQGEGAKKKR